MRPQLLYLSSQAAAAEMLSVTLTTNRASIPFVLAHALHDVFIERLGGGVGLKLVPVGFSAAEALQLGPAATLPFRAYETPPNRSARSARHLPA